MKKVKKENLKEKEFGIQEISELLNISQSALRYYEKKNLITTLRDEMSNYRKYSYMTLIELTDIIMYRNLGISVNQLPNMLCATVNEEEKVLEERIDKTEDEIQDLFYILKRLKYYRRKIQKYRRLKETGYQIVKKPEIEKIVEFPFSDPEYMNLYIENPDRYAGAIMFTDIFEPESCQNAIIKDVVEPHDYVLWNVRDHKCRYLECLMKGEYAHARNGDQTRHIEYMKEHDLTPGFAIGEYLIAEYDENEKKKYDYYHLWIQIIE